MAAAAAARGAQWESQCSAPVTGEVTLGFYLDRPRMLYAGFLSNATASVAVYVAGDRGWTANMVARICVGYAVAGAAFFADAAWAVVGPGQRVPRDGPGRARGRRGRRRVGERVRGGGDSRRHGTLRPPARGLGPRPLQRVRELFGRPAFWPLATASLRAPRSALVRACVGAPGGDVVALHAAAAAALPPWAALALQRAAAVSAGDEGALAARIVNRQ